MRRRFARRSGCFRRRPLPSTSFVKDRRGHEKDLEAHEDRIGKMKDRAAQLKTNQEYQAHLFEVELANKKRGEIEEKILLAMEQIEQTQRTIVDVQAKLKESEALFIKEKAKLDEKDRLLATELAELEVKQKQLSGQVEKSLLARYNKLKTKERAGAGTHQGRHLRRVPSSIAAAAGLAGQTRGRCPYLPLLLSDAVLGRGPGYRGEGDCGSRSSARTLEVGESF
jgi:hypothetical protein